MDFSQFTTAARVRRIRAHAVNQFMCGAVQSAQVQIARSGY